MVSVLSLTRSQQALTIPSHRHYLFSCSYEVFTLESALKRHKKYRHAVTPVSQQSSK